MYPTKAKLDSLILLRGIAVIAVCSCHFGGPLSFDNEFAAVFKWLDNYGKYGVQIFFVISGFIIPLSLDKANYSIRNYGQFLWKRVIRLHPPYLFALATTLIIASLAYKVRDIAYPEDFTTIFKSLFYFHIPSDNPVFWTLAVEAQFYIFIGLAFIIFRNYPNQANVLFVPFLLLLNWSFNLSSLNLCSYINYFLIGTVGYQLYRGHGNRIINAVTLGTLIIYTFITAEYPASISAFLTILIILFYKKPIPKVLKFPGEVSYSIYLLHFPIGVKFLNFLIPRVSSNLQPLLFIVDVTLIFVLSWLFWRFIENPIAHVSSNIRFTKRQQIEDTIRVKPECRESQESVVKITA